MLPLKTYYINRQMIKQLLNSAIAKYRDLSMARRSIICLCLRHRQIIDLLATDKSRYFAQFRPIIVYYGHHLFRLFRFDPLALLETLPLPKLPPSHFHNKATDHNGTVSQAQNIEISIFFANIDTFSPSTGIESIEYLVSVSAHP